MAKADIKMPDEFLEKLSRLAKDEDSMAERVLNAGAESSAEARRKDPGPPGSFWPRSVLPASGSTETATIT